MPVRNSIQAAAVAGYLKKEGVNKFDLTEIPIPNMGMTVAKGDVAGAVLSEPFVTQSLGRGDGKVLAWISGGYPFEHFQVTFITFSTKFLKSNPDAVKAYLRAHLKAVKWINENIDEARTLFSKYQKVDAEIAKKMNLLSYPLDPHSNPKLLEDTVKVLLDNGIIKKPVAVNQMVDESLLDAVLKEEKR